MRRRRVLGLIGALGFAPAAARAQVAPQPVPLKDAFVLLEVYLELDAKARNRFGLAYCALRGNQPFPEAKAIIRLENGAVRPLLLAPDGAVTDLPNLKELDSLAELEVDGPPFKFELEVRATLAPAQQFSAEAIKAALDQASIGVTNITGVDTKLTAAYFPDGGAGTIDLGGGHTLPLPSYDFRTAGSAAYFEPDATPGAVTIDLARPPSRVILARTPPKSD